eukprot:533817-Rhodomonas_salina.1
MKYTIANFERCSDISGVDGRGSRGSHSTDTCTSTTTLSTRCSLSSAASLAPSLAPSFPRPAANAPAYSSPSSPSP